MTTIKTNAAKVVQTVAVSVVDAVEDVCYCQHRGDQHGTNNAGTCRFTAKPAPNGCGCTGFRALDV